MTAYCIVGKVTPSYAVIRPSWLYPIMLHIQARATCIPRTSFTISKQMSISIAALFFYIVLWVIINRDIEIFLNHSSMCSPRVTVCISNCVVYNIVWALVSDLSICTSDECIAVVSRSWHVLFSVRFTIVQSRTMFAYYVTTPLNIGVL